ncbi:hypothetical protein LLP99_17005 [Rouxiella badensis]|uniref:hypothetical protein n=1 Tax=Rouxiella badensis TaxID=1646377 RepID=UPI001D15CD98|nr:hypothetical protein [Rouxiella badensis]MCC3717973.1 hypothetical protein [Rouxiella badensis]MCC3730012.1 hypothetical protein [Rouxiella badensis]
MKSGLTIRVDNLRDVLDALKQLGNKDVLVGIPSDRAERQDGMEINNAELGYLHSFGGTIRIPEHMTTVYRQISDDGSFKRNGQFVQKAKSNFATSHKVAAYSVQLPPRPFLHMGMAQSRDEVAELMKQAAVAALSGNADQAEVMLNRAGVVASQAAKQVITAGDQLTPLSERTLESRRSRGRNGTKPLYDTGQLLRSITYVVRSKNA